MAAETDLEVGEILSWRTLEAGFERGLESAGQKERAGHCFGPLYSRGNEPEGNLQTDYSMVGMELQKMGD